MLADATVRALTPARLGGRAVELYHRLEADRIVAEVNQGGDMVEAVIATVDRSGAGEGVRAAAENGCAPSRSRRSTSRAG